VPKSQKFPVLWRKRRKLFLGTRPSYHILAVMAKTHVISALRAKRAEISGHVQDLEKKVKTYRARLAHIDETIKIFSPDTDPDSIPAKRTYRRARYFSRGEMARLCLDALRKADGPLSTAELLASVIKAKGLPDSVAASLTEKALSYLRLKRKSGTVIKSGTTQAVRWSLAEK
jgi:hypothetical protein